jgi:antitoxin component YwqK of YwqJK toxin-antitoxin module
MFCPAITALNTKCNVEIKQSEKYCYTHKKLSECSSVDSKIFNENTFILDRSAPNISNHITEQNIQCSYFKNGNIRSKYISNDKYLQRFTYFENGKLHTLENFILEPTRKLHGYQYRYHWNGQMDYKEHYIHGLAEGKQYSWSINGDLMNMSNFKNNVNHGPQYSWYDNENLSYVYNFIDGEKIGLQQNYNYFGELEYECYCL